MRGTEIPAGDHCEGTTVCPFLKYDTKGERGVGQRKNTLYTSISYFCMRMRMQVGVDPVTNKIHKSVTCRTGRSKK